jgi:hypothetical protein
MRTGHGYFPASIPRNTAHAELKVSHRRLNSNIHSTELVTANQLGDIEEPRILSWKVLLGTREWPSEGNLRVQEQEMFTGHLKFASK